ncbi:unnamed protein product [Bursaphelenchus okinawaensis]|uniref:Nucleotide-diphospho-sugar transferase domain-containing protein n=1 Tax=Bursaphelenchus okinawaensis TaxID=465554 RepID=A0A811LM36_9BILA|nr:unnamed protein product [Bursaphelenchus okinawaensis]CAG9126402.1 unnamed protein product [Bursaphelenchus okinawaensis]
MFWPILFLILTSLAQNVVLAAECEAANEFNHAALLFCFTTAASLISLVILFIVCFKFRGGKLLRIETRLFTVMDQVLQNTLPIVLTEEMLYKSLDLKTQENIYHASLANYNRALEYLNEAAKDFVYGDFSTSVQLNEVLERTRSPHVILLNKHALNVTLNFVCNLRHFNATSGVVAFAFDYHSYTVMKGSFPEISVIYWKMMSLEDRFQAGDGRYQLFQYFRARLSSYLSTTADSFWMIQADTIWKKNFFTTVEYSDADLLFDQEGEEGLLSEMTAGGYYYVKSNEKSFKFFKNIGDTLLEYYVTDNNLMTRQCLLQMYDVTCRKIPYSTLVNWRYEPREDRPEPPFVQFDGGEGAEEKFLKMKKAGALYVDPESLSEEPRPARCLPLIATEPGQKVKATKNINKANWVIRSAHQATEWLCLLIPRLRTFILGYVFPFYAYFLAI